MTITEPAPADTGAAAPKAERWTAQWKELYAEVDHDRAVHRLRRAASSPARTT